MVIPLVEAEEVQRGREKTKGEKYAKYAQAIAHVVPWFLEQIEASSDGKIRVMIKDITHEMGADFEKKSDSAIYWGLKFVLFHNGIVVEAGKAKAGGKLLVMRKGNSQDKLPPSLCKVLEPPEEEMPMPGEEEVE